MGFWAFQDREAWILNLYKKFWNYEEKYEIMIINFFFLYLQKNVKIVWLILLIPFGDIDTYACMCTFNFFSFLN